MSSLSASLPGPTISAGHGWLRRLATYCWRYRGSVLLAFGASLAGMAVAATAALARRQIGGYTGDVLGASEQLFEVGFLLAVAAV